METDAWIYEYSFNGVFLMEINYTKIAYMKKSYIKTAYLETEYKNSS